MNCKQVRENLTAYLDDEVEPEQRAQIAAHLSTCVACAAELKRLRALQTDLESTVPAGLDRLRLSDAASDRIRQRLQQIHRQAEQRPLDWLPRWLRPRPALLKAAIPTIVALFVVAALLFTTQPLAVQAQETLVLAPDVLTPDSDAALRVIVRQAGSTRPIAGAQVSVRLEPQRDQGVVLYEGRTGEGGTADVRFRVPDYGLDKQRADLIVSTASKQGKAEIVHPVSLRRSYLLYLTSDKPLYQPGQTVHLRVLALEAAQRYPVADRQVRFAVYDPDGKRLLDQSKISSRYGIASADLGLEPTAPSGTYRLTAALGDTLVERTVTVGHYRHPQFRVEVTTARSYYLAGQTAAGQIEATTFEGTPIAAAQATLHAYLDAHGRPLIGTAQGQTGADGAFAWTLGLPSTDQIDDGARLILEATVTAAQNETEWAGQVVPLAIEPLAIDVIPEGGRLRPGIPNAIYVLAAAPDGSPVQAQLHVEVAKSTYDLHTDPYGLAQFSFTPDPGVREVQLHLAASTPDGRATTRTAQLSADRGPSQILLRLDRAAYEVGEVIHAAILNDAGPGTVYLDIVRRSSGQPISTQVIRLDGGQARAAIDVAPQMVGTIQVTAYQILADGTVAQDTRIAVVDAPREVSVEIRPDRAAYRAGDVARVEIETQLNGAPVQSALGIAVVDESVFALEARAPGFAKLYFLLERSLLDLEARPLGISLPDLIDPSTEDIRAAQNRAARAAWAALDTGVANVQRSVSESAAPARWMWPMGLGLGAVLLCIPIALWGIVIDRIRRAVLPTPFRWGRAILLIGLFVLLAMPLAIALVLILALLLADQAAALLLALLVVAWLAALIALTVEGARHGDDGLQLVVLLVGAYGIVGALLGYLAERGADLGALLGAALAATFIPALIALVLLAIFLWRRRRMLAALALIALALLTITIPVLAGLVLRPTSPFGQALTDPARYAGPLAWLSGCSALPQTVPPSKVEQEAAEPTQIVETVIVEKEATTATGQEARPTQAPPPTSTPPPSPSPASTSTPAPVASPPVAVVTATPEPPPPMLGQVNPETLLWLPEAITDQAGQRTIEIALPHIPATWRLTVLASTRRGELGAASTTLHAQHP